MMDRWMKDGWVDGWMLRYAFDYLLATACYCPPSSSIIIIILILILVLILSLSL
jgi:hypothetical protein